jgi:hypothetical protein
MAMELRNRVQTSVKVRLSVADLLAGPTIDELAVRILDAMALDLAPGPALEPSIVWEEGSL